MADGNPPVGGFCLICHSTAVHVGKGHWDTHQELVDKTTQQITNRVVDLVLGRGIPLLR